MLKRNPNRKRNTETKGTSRYGNRSSGSVEIGVPESSSEMGETTHVKIGNSSKGVISDRIPREKVERSSEIKRKEEEK